MRWAKTLASISLCACEALSSLIEMALRKSSITGRGLRLSQCVCVCERAHRDPSTVDRYGDEVLVKIKVYRFTSKYGGKMEMEKNGGWERKREMQQGLGESKRERERHRGVN